MPMYTVTRASAALSTSSDLLTIVASATKPLRIYMVDFKGMGTSSAVNEVVMSRSTGGATGGNAVTPQPNSAGSGAASFQAFTTFSTTQPTLATHPLWRFGVNANGAVDKFVALPGAEISVPVGGQVSFRSTTGTSNVTLNVMVEEIDG